MKTKSLPFLSFIFILFLFFNSSAQNTLEKSIVISKTNLRQILTDNNQKQSVNIIYDGFETIPIDNNIKIIKKQNTEINTPKKKAVIELTNNIVEFRKYLETNDIKYIYADGLKIRSSNIITQEEANKLSSTIIDTPPMLFKTEYNDSTKVGYYQFNLYYYKTKLYVSMDNYSDHLLNGYIDLFQNRIEETKARLTKFN
jgi:hypothetical protein